MTTSRLSNPVPQFFDANGDPLSGGKLYFYYAGTSTPATTYADEAGGTPNANPLVLNSRGECECWVAESLLKVVLRDSAGALIWTRDNVFSIASLALATGSNLIGFVQGVGSTPDTGATTRTVQNKLRDWVSIMDYGDGVSSDALTKALAASNSVYIPEYVSVVLSSAVTISDNKQLHGPGKIYGTSGSSSGCIIVSGDNVLVDGVTFNAGGTSAQSGLCGITCVVNSGSNVTFNNNKFSGKCGNAYLAASSVRNPRFTNNQFDCSDGLTAGLQIFFTECFNPIAEGNTFYDTTGFGIQVRTSNAVTTPGAYVPGNGLSSGGSVSNNTFFQPAYTQTHTIIAGEETGYTFTLTRPCDAGCALLAGTTALLAVPIAILTNTHTSNDNSYPVTYAAQAIGTVLVFKGWRSEESINVVGNVKDLIISHNTIDGGGDGGIVMGYDNYFGVPQRLSIIGNTIRNLALNGINQDFVGCTATIMGNSITDCCQADTSDNGAAISVITKDITVDATHARPFGGGKNVVVGNFITNTLPNFMSQGVLLNGNYGNTSGIVDGGPEQDFIFGNNIFNGTFKNKYFINQTDSGQLLGSVMVNNGLEHPYPAQMTADIELAGGAWTTATVSSTPANSAYFTYSMGPNNTAGSTGMTRYATNGKNLLGGSACLMTRSSAYMEVQLTTEVSISGAATGSYRSYFAGDLFKLMMKVKVLNGTAFMTVFGGYLNTGTLQPVTIYIPATAVSGSVWSNYSISFPCNGLSNIDRIRIGQVGAGTAFFQHPYIAGIQYGTQ